MQKIISSHNRIGIWGFGATGKSAFNYFDSLGYHIHIMDQRCPTISEQKLLDGKNVTWFTEKTIDDRHYFFNSSDIIIPSPGINIQQNDYEANKEKLCAELDFFYHLCHKPIIAITGSIGKTSITSLLYNIFQKLSVPIMMGGNIGVPTFDLINNKDVDFALLEVSSFQLMHCKHFAPKLSIWANFHPNHLDYHQTEFNYFSAKATILRYQQDGSLSLVPWILRQHLPLVCQKHIRGYFSFIFPENVASLKNNEIIYYIHDNTIIRYNNSIHTPLLELTQSLLQISFLENILIISAACDLLGIDINVLYEINLHLEHRLEKISEYNNITFYNDSKGTTTASSKAAIEKLGQQPLHLFLGGLSKGVDRTFFIQELHGKVKHIYCFGKEAHILYDICNKNGISATHYNNLEDAFNSCITLISSGDCVLFSPAGSSHDLYDNYEQRGNHFKKLTIEYIKRHSS